MLLVFALVAYGIMHGATYYFYRFIPEWDSYSYIEEIERYVESGVLETTYRGFFRAAVTLLASLSRIEPYALFSFWIVGLQAVIVIVLYRLMALYRITNTFISGIILLSPLAVPVLVMEMDVVRPQSIALIFFPVYFYFLYRAVNKNEYLSWIVSSIIVIGGLMYYEYFAFLLLIHIAWVTGVLFLRYVVRAVDKKDRTIFFLAVTSLLFSVLYFANSIRFLRYAFSVASNVLVRLAYSVTDSSLWTWWFLDQYQTDGESLQMGWASVEGAIKYYAYLMSPYVLGIIVLSVFIIWKKPYIWKDIFVYLIFPVLAVFLLFAEILPRINFYLLPERAWIFISLLMLLISVPVWFRVEKKCSSRCVISLCIIFTFSILIGSGGALYIAASKKALTSTAEYNAVQWITENTPPDAVFITQAANSPMIRYFAKRVMVDPGQDFFMSDQVHAGENYVASREAILQEQLEVEREKLNSIIEEFKESELLTNEIEEFIKNYNTIRNRIMKIEKEIADLPKAKEDNTDTYILYSEDKFDSLYAQREWWRISNYYGANLEKFNDLYPTVYNKDGVRIWSLE